MTQASNLGKGGSNFNSTGQLSLTTGVTGVLPIANGGTGSSSALVPSGTAMLFKQTASPTGWTKVTTDNDAALRVVSGTASTGGTVAFTTAFASQAVSGTVGTSGATTLTASQIPAHTHGYSGSTGTVSADHSHSTLGSAGGYDNNMWHYYGGSFAASDAANNFYLGTGGASANHTHAYSGTTDNGTGGGTSHTHAGGTFTGTAINLAVKYVDVIVATKD